MLARAMGILLALLLLVPPAVCLGAEDRSIGRVGNPAQGRRLALVIGNAAYGNRPLRNPVNDARAMAKMLKGLGFEVIEKHDLKQTQMKMAIDRFGKRLKQGAVGLFFFSGHGAQVKGENYMLPLGADIAEEELVEYQAVKLGRVLAWMEAARAGLNIVLLDACRDNPYAAGYKSGRAGLAPVGGMPRGTVIAFAAAAGKRASDGSGPNSPFTAALLRQLPQPGREIRQALYEVQNQVYRETRHAQQPWLNSSPIEGNFYLRAAAGPDGAEERARLARESARLAAERARLQEERDRLEKQRQEQLALLRVRPKPERPSPPPAPKPPIAGKSFTNSLGMKFVLIPAGSFLMGSPQSKPERSKDEGPQHRVTISKSFYMQTREVTQGQWKAVMGNNPSHFKKCGDRCPVERVGWYDVQKFIRRLNAREGAKRYRLPTEAEWEYACRAGTTTPFSTGANITTDQANYNGGPGYAKGEYRRRTVAVGSFRPNAWGLYDMHGNVSEWCQDRYGAKYYASSPSHDPQGPDSGIKQVVRGGSWYSDAWNLRSAWRNACYRGDRIDFLGFRLARITP